MIVLLYYTEVSLVLRIEPIPEDLLTTSFLIRDIIGTISALSLYEDILDSLSLRAFFTVTELCHPLHSVSVPANILSVVRTATITR